MKQRTRRSDEGVALALALIATLLVVIISFEVAYTSRIEQFIVDNFEVDTKLELACHGGFEVALARLREDRQQTEIDSAFDNWYEMIVHQDLIESDVAEEEFLYVNDDAGFRTTQHRDVLLHIRVFDECGKFNVYELLHDDPQIARKRKEALANVIDRFRADSALDLSFSEGSVIAEEVASFLKRTKDSDPDKPKPPTKTERTLVDVSELLYVNSITPTIFWDQVDEDGRVIPGLYRFITIWTAMKININTATDAALAGLFDAQQVSLADRIIEFRSEHAEEKERTKNDVSETGSFNPDEQETDPTGGAPFTQINELREKVEGISQETYNEISKFLTVQSDTFSIYVTARYDLIKRTKMYVVSRSADGFRLLFEKLVDYPFFTSDDEIESANQRAIDEQERQPSDWR